MLCGRRPSGSVGLATGHGCRFKPVKRLRCKVPHKLSFLHSEILQGCYTPFTKSWCRSRMAVIAIEPAVKASFL